MFELSVSHLRGGSFKTHQLKKKPLLLEREKGKKKPSEAQGAPRTATAPPDGRSDAT